MASFLTHYSDSLKRINELAEARLSFNSDIRPPERLVSALWFDQNLDHDNLRTVDQKKLTILSPGRWNNGPGPDFRDARIRLSGAETITGDIEVEVFSSDWFKHGHQNNRNFDNVILKVCMWDDQNGRLKDSIPCLGLFKYVVDTAFLSDKAVQDYPFTSGTMKGRCKTLVGDDNLDKALAFLQSAGDSRIDSKASRLASMARTFGYDQTLYIGLMEAIGFSQNKQQMNQIAHRITLSCLRDSLAEIPLEKHQQAILALFYGYAGIYDSENTNSDYLSQLFSIWKRITGPTVQTQKLVFSRTRPLNNPVRRLAAMSQLLAKIHGLKLFDYLVSLLGKIENPTRERVKAAISSLSEFLQSLDDPFWDYRLSLNSERGIKKYALIGQNLALVIITNVFAPLLLAWSRKNQWWDLEKFLYKMMDQLCGLPHNHKTKFASSRLFGATMKTPSFASNARIHQGLLQMYEDFCKHLHKECPDCDLMSFFTE